MLTQHARRLAWRALALACLLVGVIGVILPGLPGTPFLLVSAWAARHGWPWLEAWLIAHPRYGPPIRQWRDHGAVPRRVKWIALASMALSVALLAASPAPIAVRLLVPALVCAVAVWLWRRPEV